MVLDMRMRLFYFLFCCFLVTPEGSHLIPALGLSSAYPPSGPDFIFKIGSLGFCCLVVSLCFIMFFMFSGSSLCVCGVFSPRYMMFVCSEYGVG